MLSALARALAVEDSNQPSKDCALKRPAKHTAEAFGQMHSVPVTEFLRRQQHVRQGQPGGGPSDQQASNGKRPATAQSSVGRRARVSIGIKFLSVQNIHVMRRSMRKLTDLCLAYDSVDESQWLSQFAQQVGLCRYFCTTLFPESNSIILCADNYCA